MKEAQTVRCMLCHLADPVVPRPRSARCTVAGAAPSFCLSLSVPPFPPLSFLLGVTKFFRARSRHLLSVGWRKKGSGARFRYQVQVRDKRLLFFLISDARNIYRCAGYCNASPELGQKRYIKFNSFLIPTIYEREDVNGAISFISRAT